MDEARIQSFVEYVLRPLSEDWRLILEKLATLNIGITQQTIKQVCLTIGVWHLGCEVIRAVCYVAVTWVICQTIKYCL